jgi:hypothetical protein
MTPVYPPNGSQRPKKHILLMFPENYSNKQGERAVGGCRLQNHPPAVVVAGNLIGISAVRPLYNRTVALFIKGFPQSPESVQRTYKMNSHGYIASATTFKTTKTSKIIQCASTVY